MSLGSARNEGINVCCGDGIKFGMSGCHKGIVIDGTPINVCKKSLQVIQSGSAHQNDKNKLVDRKANKFPPILNYNLVSKEIRRDVFTNKTDHQVDP